jgi:hypothetical protein
VVEKTTRPRAYKIFLLRIVSLVSLDIGAVDRRSHDSLPTLRNLPTVPFHSKGATFLAMSTFLSI